MSTADDSNMKCAACGQEGGDGLRACTACKLVKYCGATCQRAHWRNHKKECKKRAAELHDEALFSQPLPREECPICMLPLPLDEGEIQYQACCGKVLCFGCIHAAYTADRRQLCPFCRTPETSLEEEALQRTKKRAEGGDAYAIHNLGGYYFEGEMGLPQDYREAIKLWIRAGELGCAESYYNIADSYYNGEGVGRNMKKSKHYCELAAMGGYAKARHNVGNFERVAGNADRAVKHYMIAAGSGFDKSLEEIRDGFMCGVVTKEDFEKALRAHKESKDEMKSDQRDAAAAFFQH